MVTKNHLRTAAAVRYNSPPVENATKSSSCADNRSREVLRCSKKEVDENQKKPHTLFPVADEQNALSPSSKQYRTKVL
jgi:hypothetical protein